MEWRERKVQSARGQGNRRTLMAGAFSRDLKAQGWATCAACITRWTDAAQRRAERLTPPVGMVRGQKEHAMKRSLEKRGCDFTAAVA